MADDAMSPDLIAVHARTGTIYEEHAEAYNAHRAKLLFEKPWLDRFLAKLLGGADVLDLGCGTGDPIDRYLLSEGYQVTGLDGAQAMLDIARRTFPQATWLHGDMRQLDIGRQFDGVLSWDGFFHLNRQEQAAAIPTISAHVRDGGALLLTIGHENGEVTGSVEGATVYHASLAVDAYERLLTASGFQSIEHVLEDPGCDFHSVILASNKMTNT